uniref:Uncharacterized protein n=1 Tax=Daphnia magna TaxID=35525 RepID=A0A0P5AF11_9CRUS
MYTNSFNIYSTNDLQAKYNDDIELLKDSKYPSDFMKPQVRSMHVRSYYMLAVPRIVYTPYTFTYMLCASLRTSDTSLNVRKQDEKSLRKTKIYSAHGCHFLDMVAPLYNRPENGEPHQ